MLFRSQPLYNVWHTGFFLSSKNKLFCPSEGWQNWVCVRLSCQQHLRLAMRFYFAWYGMFLGAQLTEKTGDSERAQARQRSCSLHGTCFWICSSVSSSEACFWVPKMESWRQRFLESSWILDVQPPWAQTNQVSAFQKKKCSAFVILCHHLALPVDALVRQKPADLGVSSLLCSQCQQGVHSGVSLSGHPIKLYLGQNDLGEKSNPQGFGRTICEKYWVKNR